MNDPRTEEAPFDPAELIRLGQVASVDLAQGTCRVAMGDLLSGPIRWVERAAGATRTWSPPAVGEQVLLICPYGELAGALALRGVNCDAHPAAGNSAEEVIIFADGARIAYDPAAHILTAHLPGGSTVNITADNITITGDVAITGNVSVTGQVDASVDVTAAGTSLKSHRHGGVASGGAQSGPPV